MKLPDILILRPAVVAGFSLVTPAFATVSIDYVPVGNAGNAADVTGYGAVDYVYNIGTYEISNSQYADFLNAKGASNATGIFNASMASYGITQTGISGSFSYYVTSGFENKPVVYVTWFDAARFTNWLGNGQGSGDMEKGSYTLDGVTSGIVTVNSGATVYLPSEDEWYKAAYYNGATASYSLYPNAESSITIADANYNSFDASNVGYYISDPSSYGTFDQGGNVAEWNDAVISASGRGIRGGSWSSPEAYLLPTTRASANPMDGAADQGFRVASVPEPTLFLLTVVAGGGMLTRRRREYHCTPDSRV